MTIIHIDVTDDAITGWPETNGGVYAVLFHLVEPSTITFGALGKRQLPPGTAVYVGSARRGLRARVERHLRLEKPVRWHIDALSTRRNVGRVGAVLVPGERVSECALNQAVGAALADAAAIDGVGASDCRAGCPAHLWVVLGRRIGARALAESLRM